MKKVMIHLEVKDFFRKTLPDTLFSFEIIFHCDELVTTSHPQIATRTLRESNANRFQPHMTDILQNCQSSRLNSGLDRRIRTFDKINI